MKSYLFGEWTNDTIDIKSSTELIKRAKSLQDQLSRYPIQRIYDLFDRVRHEWVKTDSSYRVKTINALKNSTGLSESFLQKAVDSLYDLFDQVEFKKKMNIELHGVSFVEDKNHTINSDTILNCAPLGTLLHIISGNVSMVSAGSLFASIITKNITIIKVSAGDQTFIREFIDSIKKCDHDGIVSSSIAVIYYSHSETEIIELFKNNVDGIVLWGGEQALQTYRNNLPARTRMIVFGPKISIAYVEDVQENTAKCLANDIAIWDQKACTAPQICYVVGRSSASKLAKDLSIELEKKEVELPQGDVDINSAVEIRKLRSVHEIASFRGEGELYESNKELKWTVIVDLKKEIEPSPLYRTIRIIPVEDLNELLTELEPLRGYVQTIGISSSEKKFFNLSQKFIESGVLRTTLIGDMANTKLIEPHDGVYDMQLFVRIVPQTFKGKVSFFDRIDMKTQKMIIENKFRNLLFHAKKSKYYGKILDKLKIESISDIVKLPVITRDIYDEQMSSIVNGFKTRDLSGGYVTKSGGSTGEPKYSIYDGQDWEILINESVKAFGSMGFDKSDKVANCFVAGNLYGSFVSFDHINARLGMTSFAFSSVIDESSFLKSWEKFRFNVVQGTPSSIVPLLRKVKSIEPAFTIEKIMYAGLPLMAEDYYWLKDKLKVKLIASVLGCNDGGLIAYQCCNQRGAFHHLMDGYNYVEIVDSSGNQLPDGEVGRILITSLMKTNFVLIRYDIGDLGRIVGESCLCGSTSRTIELLGRSDDLFVIGNNNYNYSSLLGMLSNIPFTAFQIELSRSSISDLMQVNLELDDPSKEIERSVKEMILDKAPLLKKDIDAGLVKINVTALGIGEIKRNERTGKIKSVIDLRQKI